MEEDLTGPIVTPGTPKGSGRKAPWVVMGVVTFAAMCVAFVVALGVVIFLLRS